MAIVSVPKFWETPEREVTPEATFFNRRRLLKALLGASVGTTILPILGCEQSPEEKKAIAASLDTAKLDVTRNPAFFAVDRPITNELLAGQYNNFYEFGGTKSIWKPAQTLPIQDWKVEVSGLVKNPHTYDLDELQKKFPLEERIYRFRCVEAWSMAIPWIGFPMKSLIAAVEPTSKAKFVSFTSYYNPKVTVEFQETQPATFWNTINAYEYDFEANVNPDKPHPRWSQATEKFVGEGPKFSWEKRQTLPYNGYGEYVASLYS